ncbi:orotate phosphoribosyltransferase [Brachybacterium faecium DSM 4810]|uniref:Orotate phosphoribosyltransferase n=1 Tax=Brachybacterium faecium (strain ATCC 43885 / DSM 4810 / JCM 11609 / LMG 19847 / NBRC 14762 / NCIMB 9860 / 6-10) TaxID=446465 RepID=C7MGC6_BRAFD|nr:orotate phosphoribosyltransferase [Brachybacterium faecium]ACU86359.1 orotate phosphoribosyltransferase [Brachybacterium faecium DSM 4810]
MSAPRIAPAHSLPIADARERLRELIRDLAVVRGHVVLSSGAEADHYVDLRRITLHHEAAPLVGRVMLDLLRREGLVPGVKAVGGLTLGADPVATSILHASAADEDLDPLDAFVVRKANKAHGLQRRIEGPDVTGRRVVAVEDTSTTGGSVLTACEALAEGGADIAAVAVIVHRSEASREAVEAAGHRYLAAYDISELEI